MDPVPTLSHRHSLRRWSLASGFTAFAARQAKGIRMLMYHGVDSVFTAQDLDEQLAWIKARHPILPFAEVAERMRNGKPLPDFAVVLTFDDGLRNNVTEAAPVLLKHQVPATFFVCPDLIDAHQWVWTYEVRARLRDLTEEALKGIAQRCGSGDLNTLDAFMKWAKKLPQTQRQTMLDTVRAATVSFTPSKAHCRSYDLATWDELQTLDSRLITIGSHTMSHPILSSLTDAEIEYELEQSKQALMERGLTKDSAALLCYPDGNHDERVLACARQHYTAACSTRKGIITDASPLHALPRIGASSPLADVAWRLWRPQG